MAQEFSGRLVSGNTVRVASSSVAVVDPAGATLISIPAGDITSVSRANTVVTVNRRAGGPVTFETGDAAEATSLESAIRSIIPSTVVVESPGGGRSRTKLLLLIAGGLLGLCVIVGIIAALAGGDGDDDDDAAVAATSTPARTATTGQSTATIPAVAATATTAATETPADTPTVAEPTATATPEPTDTPAPPTNTPEPAPTATMSPPPQPVVFSGAGNSLSQPFELHAGLITAHVTHDGSSNFIAWLLNQTTGQQTALLANEIGVADARYAALISEDGTYLVEISADGNWTVDVLQPDPATSERLTTPWEQSGTGAQVYYFLHLTQGVHRVAGTHDGTSNFIVYAYPAAGDFPFPDLVFNEIGAFTGEQGLQIRDEGDYLISVEADGNWTLRIE